MKQRDHKTRLHTLSDLSSTHMVLLLKVNDMSRENPPHPPGGGDEDVSAQISREHCSHLKQVSMRRGKKSHKLKGKASIGKQTQIQQFRMMRLNNDLI